MTENRERDVREPHVPAHQRKDREGQGRHAVEGHGEYTQKSSSDTSLALKIVLCRRGRTPSTRKVPPVWGQSLPLENRYQAQDGYGQRHEEKAVGRGGQLLQHCGRERPVHALREVVIDGNPAREVRVLGVEEERDEEAGDSQDREDVRQSQVRVAAPRDKLVVEQPLEEVANKQLERPWRVRRESGPVTERKHGETQAVPFMTSTMSCATFSVSCSRTSCKKISSSVGSLIRSRSRSTESCATTRPL